jgi:hypothetical protein
VEIVDVGDRLAAEPQQYVTFQKAIALSRTARKQLGDHDRCRHREAKPLRHTPAERHGLADPKPTAAHSLPSRISRAATSIAVSLPIAKQMPCAIPIIAVLTPTTRPNPSTSGPPKFPGLSGASVWIIPSMRRPERVRRLRPSALTIPAVTVA